MTIKAPAAEQAAARDLETALAYWNRHPGTARAVRILIAALEAYRRQSPTEQEEVDGPASTWEVDRLAA